MDNNQNPILPIHEVLKKTLETLDCKNQPQITPLPLNSGQKKWCEKWLKLQTQNHPQLVELERQVFEFCRGFSKAPFRGTRLLIWGKNGVGKTHCAKAIHHWANLVAMKLPLTHIANEDGDDYQLSRAQYLFWPGIVDGFKRDQWGVIDEACEQSLLVLDDIGAEHDPSGIGREKLYYILERRSQKWTVLTTNYSPDEWEIKFEPRIASRLLRNCVSVDLSSVPDFGSRSPDSKLHA